MVETGTKKRRSKPKVLLIGVDRDHVKDIAKGLRAEGFSVSGCSTARGALGRVRREMPDAVIVEVIMPLMSGFDIGARMQADPKLSHIPIFFTTDIQDSNGESLDYFSRPLQMPNLVSALRSRIRSEPPPA
jgi:DNA-binding response OmpR family regulator